MWNDPVIHSTRTPGIHVVLFDVGCVLVELNGMETLLDWLGSAMTAEEMWVKWLRSDSVRQFETGLMEADEFAVAVTRESELDIEPA